MRTDKQGRDQMTNDEDAWHERERIGRKKAQAAQKRCHFVA